MLAFPVKRGKASVNFFTLCSTHERFGHSLSLQSFHHQIGVPEQGLYGHREPWYIHQSINKHVSRRDTMDYYDVVLTSASHTRTV